MLLGVFFIHVYHCAMIGVFLFTFLTINESVPILYCTGSNERS